MTNAELDQNLALSTREPYFAPNFTAARPLLDSARPDGAGLRFPSGARCDATGCSCGNRGCLHTTAFRVTRESNAMDFDVARSCTRKRQLTEKEADREARRLEQKEQSPMKTYRCTACGWWHVAHERSHNTTEVFYAKNR